MSGSINPRRSLWILAGLLVGGILGVIAQRWFGEGPRAIFFGHTLQDAVASFIKPVGSIFLRIIFMVVVPLIISAIVLGVTELGDVRRLGRVGLRCVAMTLLLSGLSVIVGLTLVNVFSPGKRISPEVRERLVEQYAGQAGEKVAQGQKKTNLSDTLLNLIPQNPVEESVNAFNPDKANGGLIAVMVFALFVGTAMTMIGHEHAAPLKALLESIFRVCLQIIDYAMMLAPVCVGCLSFSLMATTGWELLRSLLGYFLVVVGGMALHLFGVYALVVWLLGGRSPFGFFRDAREAMFTAFGTSSSNATLPVAMRVAEESLRLPPKISRFVLTVGASANQNGTALYEGVTVLFLAQVFGVELTLAQQFTVALMCILAGVGTAGVPGGSLPLVVGVLMTINVPAQSIAIILGIDRFLDMCRTTLNVTGDLVIATVVARGSKDDAG